MRSHRFHSDPRRQGRPRQFSRKSPSVNPKLDPQLGQSFKRIGVPEPAPFTPDPFQVEALESIREHDVLVSAPTGAGKTWIASQAIARCLSRGLRTWYASPLKALSNSIYREFRREFGPEKCGILTGDRKENAGAPVVVGTTEILRNQLYDAMHEGLDIQADLVILDEAHYLSDPDRGVVWEEVLIYLPSRVRLLLLSATISNGEEIAAWLKETRGRRMQVVRSRERPVPLEMLFLFPDGLISPLAGKKGLVPRVKKFLQMPGGRGRRGGRLNYGEIIQCLRAFDLLPAIFFLKSRADCDRALFTCSPPDNPYEARERVKREVRVFLQKYPHLERHRQMRYLLDCAVTSHHAGQLPYWKVLVEEMMNKGYLEAIFSTSTVAAGVNFPARTVVLVQSDRFDGHQFSNLTSTELHQMTGRAGRRGKDNIGFALVVPGTHQDPQFIVELRDLPPEPLLSQIHINFSMTLNLLLSHTPHEVRDMLDRSFASFQQRRSGSLLQTEWGEMVDALKRAIPRGRCDTEDPFEVLEHIQRRTEIHRQAKRLERTARGERLMQFYSEHLQPGRLILHKNRNVYVVFRATMEEGHLICAAHNLKRNLRVRKGRITLRNLEIHQIKDILDHRVDLPEDYSLAQLSSLLASIPTRGLKPLDVGIPPERETAEEGSPERVTAPSFPCEECEHLRVCHSGKRGEMRTLLRRFRALESEIDGLKGGLWLSFKRHLRFLRDTGFVDGEDRLTADGRWASKLRLDHPLLIAEAIRRGAFEGVGPEAMAGCIAPFVWDRVQDQEVRVSSPMGLEALEAAFNRMHEQIEEMRRFKTRRGFENPPILFWPAASLFLWAKGVPWEELVSFIPVDDGDMASLMIRTADHLRQVANLEETHPRLASAAREAIRLILREPVFLD
ncbi:MAG: DEAD/DEAH box helicase [Deltaproteobacteria bacterium]|nr:DEAD/DEAH box helicase [Deltaproteobacteria bacterium]